MRDIDLFYHDQEEPLKSCLQALHDIIISYHPGLEHVWKYKLPCFLLGKKIFCYIWVDRKTQHPYIAVGQGIDIDHPALIQGKRTWSKLLMIDPSEDIPVDTIHEVFDMAMELY